jgi:hypothetical protein
MSIGRDNAPGRQGIFDFFIGSYLVNSTMDSTIGATDLTLVFTIHSIHSICSIWLITKIIHLNHNDYIYRNRMILFGVLHSYGFMILVECHLEV